jgi:hypothetical protein
MRCCDKILSQIIVNNGDGDGRTSCRANLSLANARATQGFSEDLDIINSRSNKAAFSIAYAVPYPFVMNRRKEQNGSDEYAKRRPF